MKYFNTKKKKTKTQNLKTLAITLTPHYLVLTEDLKTTKKLENFKKKPKKLHSKQLLACVCVCAHTFVKHMAGRVLAIFVV